MTTPAEYEAQNEELKNENARPLEAELNNDQTNQVLSLYDDTIGALLSELTKGAQG